jgi:glucose-1-phosphate adenylyltransferase
LPHRHAIIDRDVQIPDGTVIGYDQNEDRRRITSSRPVGLTVVARDYSLYESPVSPEFMRQA